MWSQCLEWSEDKKGIIARLAGDVELSGELDETGLIEQLSVMNAASLFVDLTQVSRFVDWIKAGQLEVFEGIVIAQRKNAQLEVELSNNDMLASMIITGAYGGRGLSGTEIVDALTQARVTKGINKLALKKVMQVSVQLAPGEKFTQAVAVGKPPIKGSDTVFTPLVKDITKRILKPKQGESTAEKIDLRNLGETISVNVGDALMRRTPATKGTPGFTVQGRIIPTLAGKDTPIRPGKGTEISQHDPNLLVASISGTPLIKDKTIEVDHALCLNSVGVNTGHVKFQGNVIIGGNIESGMKVQATGSITVGGFIESAQVQAQGDIQVGKGIIGHTVSDGQAKSCQVKSKGSIRANYAQYSQLASGESIELAVHSMNNDITCGSNLTVLDASGKNGTLSGGHAKVAGKVLCLQLGVEGDTATQVEAFTDYARFKQRISSFKQQYKHAQDSTMDVVRKELEYKKRPKLERSADELADIEQLKKKNNHLLEQVKRQLEQAETALDRALASNIVEAKQHVFSRVTVQFHNEKLTTKRTHSGCRFRFNQYKVQVSAHFEHKSITA